MKHTRSRQRGAALVIGLILLVVITLLAVVGMNIANTELASATSEQLRLRAFNAAETGIEARCKHCARTAPPTQRPWKKVRWVSRIRPSIPSPMRRQTPTAPY